MFLQTDSVTEEKMRFLINNGIDMDGADSRKRNLFENILQSCSNIRDAKTILIFSKLEYEYVEIRETIARSSNVIMKLTEAVLETQKEEVFQTLLEALKLLMISPIFNLESMLYLSHQGAQISAFQRVSEISELLDVYISSFMALLDREEDKIEKLKTIYVSYFAYCNLNLPNGYNFSAISDNEKKKCLLLFVKIKEHFAITENPVETWTDNFNMTLLMKLIISDGETNAKNFEFLVCAILEEEIFSESYINVTVQNDLVKKFELSHIHGKVKPTKKLNHVIAKNQFIPLKPVMRRVPGTQVYERFVGPKQMVEQEKMMTKNKVLQQNPDGSLTWKRMMVTVRKGEPEKMRDVQKIFNDNDEDIVLPDDGLENKDAGEADSVDQLSDEQVDDNETEDDNDKASRQSDIDHKNVIMEHLDKASIASISKETFKTKNNHYKFASSVSTKFTETFVTEEPSKYYCNETNLLLVACKTKNWNVVEALLNLNPDKYPSLFTKGTKRHPLLYRDEDGQDCLIMAINNDQYELVRMLIDRLDVRTLKSELIYGDKTTLTVMSQKVDQLQNVEDEQLLDQLLKKTGQKRPEKTEVLYSYGKSCGFTFSTRNMRQWTCEGEHSDQCKGSGTGDDTLCGLAVTTSDNDEIMITENDHYSQ